MNFAVLLILAHGFWLGKCYCACRDIGRRREIAYDLMKFGGKSDGTVITRKQVANVAKCKDFAEMKQALAFNFERFPVNGSWGPNCALLYCPETKALGNLVNATGVDYYSSYSKDIFTVTGNETLLCAEKIGLFVVFDEMQNFTNARKSCEKINGILADISSYERTHGIAKIIGKDMVYAGLSNEGDNRAWKNEHGDLLSCSEFRAWDRGEPSHNRGCVALRLGDKYEPNWKVLSCKTQLPYVCEIPRKLNVADSSSVTDASLH